MSPKLSIVIPTYNMEKWLPVAVESCLAQTEPAIEVIIVNDGSSDASPQIADAYAASDDRVRVVHQENKGLGGARQAGQDAAQGEFITWLDADDFLHEKAAEDMLGVAYRDDVKMVCGNAVVFSDKTFNTRRYFYKEPVAKTTFANPAYWKSKVVWRWIIQVDFLKSINLQHPHYKLSQDVCSMYEALTQVGEFSQCGSFFYYFRQDHKSPGNELSREVEHQLAHFCEVKRILVEAETIKPLIKYLMENYFRDIKKIAPRLVGADAHWRERCIDISLEIFDGLQPEWFRDEYLAPELKSTPAMLPLVDALIARDIQAIHAEFDVWRDKGRKVSAPDKDNAFHTMRRRIKAMFKPMSRDARSHLRGYEARASKRLGALWSPKM